MASPTASAKRRKAAALALLRTFAHQGRHVLNLDGPWIEDAGRHRTLAQLAAMVWMARPLFVPSGVLAYGLGAAMGYWRLGSLEWGRAVAGLVVTEVAHLVAHYANEYADVDTDTLALRTWFSGGSGVLPAGLVPAAWARRTAIVLALLALVLTAAFIAAGLLPLPTAWIVALGLAGGWFYSMPPLQLERRGLGEIDTALVGGILMPLMGYTVQVGHPTLPAALALLPIATLALMSLLGIHWTDRTADAAVGKRSLAVIAGGRARLLHRALLVASYLLVLALTGWIFPLPVAAALLLTLPLSLWATVTFARRHSPLPNALAMAAAMAAAAAGWIAAASGL
jgi:1,4-dihydroxy-2-naphthoate octaprenyltransferase